MRALVTALLVVGLTALMAAAVTADKVTVDPNAPGVQRPASSQDEIDKRLAQKITYDSGSKRLHAVADDIAKLSGVSIACGKSPMDWRVRDIPVVVCVKDMPLGKLLRAIADATHTRVALERVANDPIRHYRIYRRTKEEQAIEKLITTEHEAKLAQVEWQWDALAAYGGAGKQIPGVDETLLPFGKLIASLGSDAKSKMLNGEMFTFRGSDSAYGSLITELQQAFWNNRIAEVGEKARNVPAPTAKDAESVAVVMKIVDEGEMGMTALNWSVNPCPAFGPNMDAGYHFGAAAALDGKLTGMPPYPRNQSASISKDDIENPDMVYLAKDKSEDWNHAPLSAKIDVDKPKELKDATLADAMRALARASGCNIVAEDFVSHVIYNWQNVDSVFAKGTTVADRLRGMATNGFHVQYQWFFGEDSKLLVGWAGSNYSWMSGTWLDHHRNLLPEKYLNDLKTKLNGPGIQFDDAVGLSSITTGSFHEWIVNSRDLFCLSTARPAVNVAVWKLYDSLSKDDKAKAKSDSGLRLAELDPELTTEFLRSSRMAQIPFAFEPKVETAITVDQRATTDPKVVSTMVMRATSSPATARSRQAKPGFGGDAFVSETPSPALKLSYHWIWIDYTIDGKKQTVQNWFLTPLPLYSPEREAEIIKAAEDKAAK